MHVVAVLPAYPPQARVGSFLATHELLAHLVSRGHLVDVLTRLRNDPVFELDGVTVGPGISKQVIDVAVAVSDLVVSHAGDDETAPRLATKWSKPSVRMVHGWHADLTERLDGATLAVFNSEHLAATTEWTGRQIVVRPPLRPIRRVSPGARVTLVNLSIEKGGELFWRLTRRLPDVQFLAVKGGWGLQLVDRRPNVEVVPATHDMAAVYAQTRILLMPSELESWGMCAVEAAQSGIPTIAHPTSGLLESMGGAATFADRDDEDAWVDAIRRLLDPEDWQCASRRARSCEIPDDRDLFATTIGGLIRGDTNGVSETDGSPQEVRRGGQGRQRQDRLQREEEQEVTV